MGKIVIATARLVQEANKVSKERLEKEIQDEVREAGTIPWVETVIKVKVLEEHGASDVERGV